jgi:hypothetical protein
MVSSRKRSGVSTTLVWACEGRTRWGSIGPMTFPPGDLLHRRSADAERINVAGDTIISKGPLLDFHWCRFRVSPCPGFPARPRACLVGGVGAPGGLRNGTRTKTLATAGLVFHTGSQAILAGRLRPGATALQPDACRRTRGLEHRAAFNSLSPRVSRGGQVRDLRGVHAAGELLRARPARPQPCRPLAEAAVSRRATAVAAVTGRGAARSATVPPGTPALDAFPSRSGRAWAQRWRLRAATPARLRGPPRSPPIGVPRQAAWRPLRVGPRDHRRGLRQGLDARPARPGDAAWTADIQTPPATGLRSSSAGGRRRLDVSRAAWRRERGSPT